MLENNTTPPAFDTMIEALDWLKENGFTHDFNLDEDSLKYNNGKHSMSPDDFSIEYVFRFEGETDPGDENIVYGISSGTHNIKGVLISAFGVYADSISQEMIRKLSVH